MTEKKIIYFLQAKQKSTGSTDALDPCCESCIYYRAGMCHIHHPPSPSTPLSFCGDWIALEVVESHVESVEVNR